MKAAIISQADLRDHLRRYIELKDCSIRSLGDVCGISFATLSRFLRGKTLSSKLTEKLFYFLNDGVVLKHKPIATKRIRCDNKEFLITIERIDS